MNHGGMPLPTVIGFPDPLRRFLRSSNEVSSQNDDV